MKKPPLKSPACADLDRTTFTFEHSEKIKIEWVLEHGNMEDWRETLHIYGEQKITEVTEWSAQMSKRARDFAKFFIKSDFLRKDFN